MKYIIALLTIALTSVTQTFSQTPGQDSLEIAMEWTSAPQIDKQLRLYSYQVETGIKEIFRAVTVQTRATGQTRRADVVVSLEDIDDAGGTIHLTPDLTFMRSDSVRLIEELRAQDLISYPGEVTRIRFKRQSIDDTDPLVTFLAAYANYRSGTYTKSIHLLEKISGHNNPSIHLLLGNAYLQRGIGLLPNIQRAYAQWDSAALFYEHGLAGGSESSDPDDESWLHNNSGVLMQEKGKLDEAQTAFENALKHMKKDPAAIRIYNNLYNIFLLKGEWTRAEATLRDCIQTLRAHVDEIYLSFTYDRLGHLYRLKMQPEKAMTQYEVSLGIRRADDNKALHADSYGFMGDACVDQSEDTTALEHYQSALDINLSLKHEPRIARSYGKLGETLLSMNQIDGAILYFDKSLELFELTGDDPGTITALNQLAEAYTRKEELQTALDFYGKSLELAVARNAEPQLAFIYDNIAAIYNKRNDTERALHYYSRASEIYQSLDHFENLSLVLFNMGLIYLKNKKYYHAYENIKMALELDQQHGFNKLSREKNMLEKLGKLAGQTGD